MRDFSLKMRAYQFIKHKIVDCEIKPGERIREDHIAAELSISRTPVREAINQLVMERLVTNIPRKGTFCVDMTPKMISDLLDIRYMIENYAIGRCVYLSTESDLAVLEEYARQFDVNAPNVIAYNRHDDEFHDKLMEIAGNEQLLIVYRGFADFYHLMRNMASPKKTPEDASAKHHWELIDCIRSKNKRQAEVIMKSHIDLMRNYLLNTTDYAGTEQLSFSDHVLSSLLKLG